MTLPRPVIPGCFYMITRRCTQRQFLLRPDATTNNAFIYCLAEAASRFDIEVLLPVAMSNHIHYVIYDRHGYVNQLTEHFHRNLAKCQNAWRGRWENFWSSQQVSVVLLADRDAVIDKLVYVATNPVADDLVARVHHWPGVNGFRALLKDEPLRARRPQHFFRKDGPMPDSVELKLTIPPELGDRDGIVEELHERVAAFETEREACRARERRRIVGRRCILRQSWRDTPRSIEPRRNLHPRVATRNKWARIEALQRNADFVIAYREARKAYLAGIPILFPVGTYWLRRFVGVPVLET